MKWNIVTDSSGDLFEKKSENGDWQVSSVPFVINVGGRDFVDDERLDCAELLSETEKCREAGRTSCPAPEDWLREFEKADCAVAVTISSKLSGSMNSAVIAKSMALEKSPEKKIAVIDSLSAGGEIALCVERICDLIEKGEEFEDVVFKAKEFLRGTHAAFALCSFNNLVKSGRMSKTAGFFANRLGIWGIGIGSDEGTIEIKGKARGSARATALLINNMKERGFEGGRVIISQCCNSAFAERLQEKIREIWKEARISIVPMRGTCSYYAERGGLIVGF
ncbi:MAG: DegV family protein [Clostridia bacterium]|nr:DegV family protein [Clostridia bacterium]